MGILWNPTIENQIIPTGGGGAPPSMNIWLATFKIPKTIKIVKINEKTDYENSLKKSVNFFFNHVKKNKAFNRKLVKKSLESSFLIFKKNYAYKTRK